MFSVLCRIIGFRSCFKTSILELGTERLWLVTLVVEDPLGSHRMVCLGRCSEPDEYNVDLCCTIALGLVTWTIAASGRSYLVLLGDLLKAGHVQSSFLNHLPVTTRHPQVTRETNGSAAFPGVLAISHPPPPDAVPGELSAGCWYCCRSGLASLSISVPVAVHFAACLAAEGRNRLQQHPGSARCSWTLCNQL